MIAEPPASTGAVNATDNVSSPGVIDVIAGAPGTVRGVTLTAFDAVPALTPFRARNLTEYSVPFLSPVIVIGLTVEVGLTAFHAPDPN